MATATAQLAATREALGPTLIRLREQGLDIAVVDGDLGKSTTARQFGNRFPERFFTLGPAEQNMIGVAAGLARPASCVREHLRRLYARPVLRSD
jgi:transketolase